MDSHAKYLDWQAWAICSDPDQISPTGEYCFMSSQFATPLQHTSQNLPAGCQKD